MNPRLLQALAIAGLAAYPFAVYLLAGRIPANVLAAMLLGLVAIRLGTAAMARRARRRLVGGLAVTAMLAGLAVLAVPVLQLRQVRLYPALISLVFFAAFFASLFTGRPLVERIARALEGDLPPAGVRYTRRVTIAWAAVLLVNSAIALATALWGSLAAWTLYNGLLSYLLLGAVFALEYFIRRRVKSRWSHAG
ncbi:MAG: hypothetical protein PVJ40_03010 [Gammaproteobacteria bacterium]|jgi:uncharacterized membrane protein